MHPPLNKTSKAEISDVGQVTLTRHEVHGRRGTVYIYIYIYINIYMYVYMYIYMYP